VLFQVIAGFRNGQRPPIRPLTGQGIEHIGHGANLRPRMNLVAFDPRRIARAVQPLVMLINHHELRPAQVAAAAKLLTVMERQRGLAVGSLQLIILLESALGVWNIRSIITASPRVTQVGLDENDLACNLGMSPLPEYDPYIYARGRLIIEATAAKVQPVGIRYPLGTQPRLLAAAEIHTMANEARNLGMKGVICPHPSWVEPVHRAFTPTADLVAYNKRVRAVFAEAVASGTAAVPLNGRMIDVPVDEWAKVVIAMDEACTRRDAEKQAARERLR